MLISPPFLPATGLLSAGSDDASKKYPLDPMMDKVDGYELAHGIYPVAFDRRWHCGVHLMPDNQHEAVRAIADGDVVAYRVSQQPVCDGAKNADETNELNSNSGFVLLKHTTETGNGRGMTFYSLYMHLMDLDEQNDRGLPPSSSPRPYALPAWLKNPTADAVSGVGKKVRRKEILGYVGKCHNMPHLHFEVFMMPRDFTRTLSEDQGYFDPTQLGKKPLVTPTTSDCWGSTYYLIRGPYDFSSSPTDPSPDSHSNIHGIEFAHQNSGTLTEGQTLYIEVYFDRGQRYTRSWLGTGDDMPLPLTSNPVQDAYVDFEYDLFKRATALYQASPAEGYEMQRFGRLLNSPVTLLTPNDRKTWISAVFDNSGKAGYIDVSDELIVKLSDADFPFFRGWQKIGDGNSPFDSDALCDIDLLKKLLGDVDALPPAVNSSVGASTSGTYTAAVASPKEWSKEDELSNYVRAHADVREKLRGLVCEAPSEWDSTNNVHRYAKLEDAGEFYENDRDNYQDFMDLLEKFQFWDKTGLAAGKKIYFFHPLEFIRHFRKCGWLNIRELAQVIRATPHNTIQSVSKIFTDQRNDPHDNSRIVRPANLYPAISESMKKYGVTSKLRMANWFGQTLHETGSYSSMRESGNSSYLTNYYEGRCHVVIQRLINGHMKTLSALGNCNPGDGVRFSGKGLIQLTGGDNYRSYETYRGGVNFTIDPGPEALVDNAYSCCDVGGYYWVSKQRYRVDAQHHLVPFEKLSINYWSEKFSFDQSIDSISVYQAIRSVTQCINAQALALEERAEFSRHAYCYLSDMVDGLSADFRPMEINS